MQLETDRLILRPWRDEDAAALYELARDTRVGSAAGWPPHESVEQSLDILQHVLHGPEQYAITLKCTDGDSGSAGASLIGAIGLKAQEDCHYLESTDEYSAGYWIGAPYWGNGYAPEAFERLIEHARDDLGAHAILADHFLDNKQSHRVMEKCGLQPIRTQLVDVLYPAGKREVLIMKRLLK